LWESETKESQWGAPIRAPDFLYDSIKTGYDVANLATVINAGVGGTAMPTWSGALTAEQLWGISHYVRSLALLRGTPEAHQLKQKLQGGAR
jgi:mono/diheme cytochrome c family protein